MAYLFWVQPVKEPIWRIPFRLEFIKVVCEQVDGKVPVRVGIADTAYQEAIAVADPLHKKVH